MCLSVNTISQKLLDQLTPNLVYSHLRSRPSMGLIFRPAGQTWPEIWGQKIPMYFKWQIFYDRFLYIHNQRVITIEHISDPQVTPDQRYAGQQDPMCFKWHFFKWLILLHNQQVINFEHISDPQVTPDLRNGGQNAKCFLNDKFSMIMIRNQKLITLKSFKGS